MGGAGLIFGVATPASATGNTLYVASAGSDTGDCTSSASPCATISYAVSQASGGDTIYVSGTIEETVTVDIPLTIAQWPDANPAIVNGTGTLSTVFTIDSGETVVIDGLTITGGSDFDGGGIVNNGGDLTVENSVISGNFAGLQNGPGGQGGGIDNDQGTLSVDDSTISDNSVSAADGNPGGQGGGIFNDEGTVSVDDSTISGNTANVIGASPPGFGGGIFSDNGAFSVDDSTIADNSAASTMAGFGGVGGGIFTAVGNGTIDDSTISGNTVSSGGEGAGIYFDGGATALAGDILATPSGAPVGGECGGTGTDDGYNIDDDGSCGFSATGSVSDSTTIDNYLGPLQNNSGPTDTIALLLGNSGTPDPAQAVIPSSFTAPGQSVAVCSQPDQRGVSRGAPCDMGAYALTPATSQLYSLPDGTASAPCITESTTPSLVCSLDTAVAEANSGSFVINLEAPTGNTIYTGTADAGVAETITAPVLIRLDPDPGFYSSALVTLDGEGNNTVLSITGNEDVDVSGVGIEDGSAPFGSHGGAIYNGGTGTLTLADDTFTDNTAGGGGAISNSNGGTVSVFDSTFTGNYSDGGGAIDNATDEGGTGTLIVTGSTFSDNTDGNYDGGAILNGWGSGDDGNATITSSTFSDNVSEQGSGGAIGTGVGSGLGTLTVSNSTFVGNTPADIDNSEGTVSTTANVFADSCAPGNPWTDGGYNVASAASCFNAGTGDNDSAGSGLSALLGPLADNVGPTQTVELLAGNPAIGIIPNPTSGLCPISVDQRGYPSPPAGACDAGAVQFAGQTIGSLSTPPSDASFEGPTYTPSATASSGLPVSISVDSSSSAVCSILTGVVSFNAPGTCEIDFNQAGDTDWSAATQVQQAITVGQGIQSIGSLSTAPSFAVVGGPGYTPSATATSGLSVSITVDPSATSVCSISTGVVSFGSAGTCTLDFNQAGNTDWLAASEVQQHFTVSPATVSQDTSGYRLVEANGGVISYGDATNEGSLAGSTLNAPIVGMATTPSGNGYWLVASDGGVFAYGDATYYGSHGGSPLNEPIVGIAATPSGKGYWLVAADGGVFSYGDASFHGSHGGSPLNKPIVGIAATTNGNGYWLVASDGGIFSYGDATFHGSHGGSPLNEPIVGIKVTPSGNGYWLAAADGGIFSYGDAPYYGSLGGGKSLSAPVVGIA